MTKEDYRTRQQVFEYIDLKLKENLLPTSYGLLQDRIRLFLFLGRLVTSRKSLHTHFDDLLFPDLKHFNAAKHIRMLLNHDLFPEAIHLCQAFHMP